MANRATQQVFSVALFVEGKLKITRVSVFGQVKKWAPWSGAGRCGAGEGRSPDKRSALRQESSDMVNQSHCSRYSPVSEAYIPLRTMITSPPDQSIRQRQKRSAYRLDNGQRNIFGSNGFSCRMPSFSKLSLGQFTVYLRGSVSPPKY